MSAPKVGIVMGSENDLEVMKKAGEILAELGVGYEIRVLSAHRTPEEAADFARGAKGRGIQVLIAGAGMAAHLAGAVVAQTILPVIGVPLSAGTICGFDSLLSTVQMPPGLPVGTMAIGGAQNAGLFAASIIALSDPELAKKLEEKRLSTKKKVLASDEKVRKS